MPGRGGNVCESALLAPDLYLSSGHAGCGRHTLCKGVTPGATQSSGSHDVAQAPLTRVPHPETAHKTWGLSLQSSVLQHFWRQVHLLSPEDSGTGALVKPG